MLRHEDKTAYQRFIQGQKEPRLTAEHFAVLAHYIKKLTPLRYQQLWVATVTSKSVEANARAASALYRKLREENKISASTPLNLNGLAEKNHIKALLVGEEFVLSINPENGTTAIKFIQNEKTMAFFVSSIGDTDGYRCGYSNEDNLYRIGCDKVQLINVRIEIR